MAPEWSFVTLAGRRRDPVSYPSDPRFGLMLIRGRPGPYLTGILDW